MIYVTILISILGTILGAVAFAIIDDWLASRARRKRRYDY